MGEVTATRADVARLFGRAAFGATKADLDAWAGKPYADVVEHLLTIPDPAARAPALDDVRRLGLEQITRGGADGGAYVGDAQRWWLERMRTTAYPLEERMVLFWHDHWATAWRPDFPEIGMLLEQNQTLRRNALGNFRTMCEQMTVDPAMLFWLNGAQNVVGAPNENYARELMELFTLGTIPQVYTEADIREAARALTGWICDPYLRLPQFIPELHDQGDKQVLGRTITNRAENEYRDIVDVALAQPVSSLFVAYRLVANFAYVPQTRDLIADPDPLIAAVADSLRTSDWNIRAAVRTMLLHDGFRYAEAASGKQAVRQPIELVVGACKAMEISADRPEALPLLNRMGQEPFDPPNVGGWPMGRDWLSAVTAIARYDWGVLVYEALSLQESLVSLLPAPGALDDWAARFGLAHFTPNTRAALTAYLASREGAPDYERRAGLIALIISSPDWMVM